MSARRPWTYNRTFAMVATQPRPAMGTRFRVERVVTLNLKIPDDLHRQVKAAAAMEGLSLKDFVIKALQAAVTSKRR
jgi:predicted HicB family RNase H-like nuclease